MAFYKSPIFRTFFCWGNPGVHPHFSSKDTLPNATRAIFCPGSRRRQMNLLLLLLQVLLMPLLLQSLFDCFFSARKSLDSPNHERIIARFICKSTVTCRKKNYISFSFTSWFNHSSCHWSKDWTIPGIWDHIGCEGLDEQVRGPPRIWAGGFFRGDTTYIFISYIHII